MLGTAQCKLAYADDKGGVLPAKYAGTFTGRRFAEVALQSFVAETFDVADEHTRKRK